MSAAQYQSQFAATDATYLLLDVRTPDEYSSGHIHDAVNIPVEELASRLSEVPKGEPLVVYCRSGRRSAEAVQILSQAGYTNIYDLGGLNDWTAQGFPVE
ncbi:MAG: rhodanese-like domain-containing protein [Anaerolineae bacterium]|nr:rhodanese-like domain-containing protein [Anaerolineae bacterium]